MQIWDKLFRRRQREEDLDEEIRAHLRMAAREHREQGETREQARQSARREYVGYPDPVAVITETADYRYVSGARGLVWTHENQNVRRVVYLIIIIGGAACGCLVSAR